MDGFTACRSNPFPGAGGDSLAPQHDQIANFSGLMALLHVTSISLLKIEALARLLQAREAPQLSR
jgi:hypothetical protein